MKEKKNAADQLCFPSACTYTCCINFKILRRRVLKVMACTRFSENVTSSCKGHWNSSSLGISGRSTSCINLKLRCCLALKGPSRVKTLPHQPFMTEGLKNWYTIQEECWLISVWSSKPERINEVHRVSLEVCTFVSSIMVVLGLQSSLLWNCTIGFRGWWVTDSHWISELHEH